MVANNEVIIVAIDSVIKYSHGKQKIAITLYCVNFCGTALSRSPKGGLVHNLPVIIKGPFTSSDSEREREIFLSCLKFFL